MDQDENNQSHDQERRYESTAGLPSSDEPRLTPTSRLLNLPPVFRNQQEYWRSMDQYQWQRSPKTQQQHQPFTEPQPLTWQQPQWREQQMHTPLERSAAQTHVAQTHPDADHFRWNQAIFQPGQSPHELRQQESQFSGSYQPAPGDRHQHQLSRDHDHGHEQHRPHPHPHPYPYPYPPPHLFRSHPHSHQVSDLEATWALPTDNIGMNSQRVWSQANRSMVHIDHSGLSSHPEAQPLSVSEPGSPILSSHERPALSPYRHRSRTLSSATPTPYQLHRLEPPSMMISSATATSELPLDPSHYTSAIPALFPLDSDRIPHRKRGRTSSLRYQSIQKHQPLSSGDFQSLYTQQGHLGSRTESFGSEIPGRSPKHDPGSFPSSQAMPLEEPVFNFQNKRPLDVSPQLFLKAKRFPESRVLETLPFDRQPNPSEFRHPHGVAERQPIVPEQQHMLSRIGYVGNTQGVSGLHSSSTSQRTDVSLRQVAPIHEQVLKPTSSSSPSQHRQYESFMPDSSYGNMLPPVSQRQSSPPTSQAPLTKPGTGIPKGRYGGPSSEGTGKGKTTTSINESPRLSSSVDTSSTLTTQLGKLLVATKEHIMSLLLSFLSKEGHHVAHDRHPRLEHVLVDLVNDMLMLHSASFVRDNISSQERPATFQPIHVLSLSHLRELMGDTSGSLMDRGSDNIEDTTLSHPADNSTRPISLAGTGANEYKSTVEFLALMTAFVSVVCWLFQSRLAKESEKGVVRKGGSFSKIDGRVGTLGEDGELSRFLSHFHDRDNVLKPIQDALATTQVKSDIQKPASENFDVNDSKSGSPSLPSQSLTGQGGGLFTWHFLLYSEDVESPLQWPSSRTTLQESCSLTEGEPLALDVILNELYSTQVLALTAKDHQKDHGQFYTPPAVVDFMWTRAISGREGKLLDSFVEYLYVNRNNLVESTVTSEQANSISLIPKVLDPCLGVSTFLSRYARLLIEEARHRMLPIPQSAASDETIEVDMDISGSTHTMLWDSASGLRLLLCQICENAWGMELDDFAYWIARCGFMANLIPLIQRIEFLSQERPSRYMDNAGGTQKDIPMESHSAFTDQENSPVHRSSSKQSNLPRMHLFCNDTLQLTIPVGAANRRDTGMETEDMNWERAQIRRLRDPSELLFDFIVTNPPYMIRKTGTFSAPDPLIYDWKVLGAPATLIALGLDEATAAGSGPPLNAVESIGLVQNDEFGVGDSSGKLQRSRQSEQSRNIGTTKSLKSSGSTRGMMQAYGYFIWFAAQRIIPTDGVLCMITASQWLTLDFAIQLRSWMIENCLMDEFFQFEPFKVFAKVQTDSLIFKIRSLPSTRLDRRDDELHETLFLRHLVRQRSLLGILEDYRDLLVRLGPSPPQDSETMDQENSIAFSKKSRQGLLEAIMPPRTLPSDDASGRQSSSRMLSGGWNYSFAPMMPTSNLTEHMLRLTQGLGGICSAGTKKKNRVQALEPLLWHRGPNTNPVYGLVVRMEYAESAFGPIMTEQWFRPALYWNGKNSPQEDTEEALHKEGQFWQNRDRLRLSRKEGSPAESYLVPNPRSSTGSYSSTSSGSIQHRHRYALCMIDKEAVKTLKKQKEGGVKGAQALWDYLVDVRQHFQPGLAASKVSKGKKATGSGTGAGVTTGTRKAAQSADVKRAMAEGGTGFLEMTNDYLVELQHTKSDESPPGVAAIEDERVAFCSTNQCGADVPEKIVHPINYGYFSKSQPRQRFFLDRASLAVTNQCIYLTLNTFSLHRDALHLATSSQELMMYFITLLNSSTLQFFVLHTCQYDQQGRMRLFRESMAKIPFQDRDLRSNNQQMMQYAVNLGHAMIDLKEALFDVIRAWRIGENLGFGSSGRGAGSGVGVSSSGGLTLLDCIRRGGDIPAGVLDQTREHLGRMLGQRYSRPATSSSSGPMDLSVGPEPFTADTDTDTNSIATETDTETDDNGGVRRDRRLFKSQDPRKGNTVQSLGGRSEESGASHLHHYHHHPPIHSPNPMHPAQYTPAIQTQDIDDIMEDRSEGQQHGTTLQQPLTANASHAPALSDQQAELPLSTLLSALPNPSPSFSSGSRNRPSSADTICDQAIRGLERAMLMVEVVQWAVDQYGYMLYGVSSSVQIQLEKELKLVYSSALNELLPSLRVVQDIKSEALLPMTTGAAVGLDQQRKRESGNRMPALETLDIMLAPLYRWDPTFQSETGSGFGYGFIEGSSSSAGHDDLVLPTYAPSVLKNAVVSVRELRGLLDLSSL